MNSDFINQLRGHILNHDLEKILVEFGKNARLRGHYNKWEFMRICLWKTSRQKQNYLTNSEKEIEDITGQAFDLKDDQDRIRKLCELHGVGIPVASALLTFYEYEKYAVIDKRCVELLKQYGLIESKIISLDCWVKYLTCLRRLSQSLELTPRQVERGLFTFHRERQMELEFANLY